KRLGRTTAQIALPADAARDRVPEAGAAGSAGFDQVRGLRACGQSVLRRQRLRHELDQQPGAGPAWQHLLRSAHPEYRERCERGDLRRQSRDRRVKRGENVPTTMDNRRWTMDSVTIVYRLSSIVLPRKERDDGTITAYDQARPARPSWQPRPARGALVLSVHQPVAAWLCMSLAVSINFCAPDLVHQLRWIEPWERQVSRPWQLSARPAGPQRAFRPAADSVFCAYERVAQPAVFVLYRAHAHKRAAARTRRVPHAVLSAVDHPDRRNRLDLAADYGRQLRVGQRAAQPDPPGHGRRLAGGLPDHGAGSHVALDRHRRGDDHLHGRSTGRAEGARRSGPDRWRESLSDVS